jgi:adhesin/invasin
MAALSAAVALAFAACGETSVNAPLPASRVERVANTNLSGPAGGVLEDPVEVRVFGTDNQPLPGATVVFNAAQGGSVSPANTTTDGDGIARTQWTLGNAAGPNTLTVTAGSATSTITAMATAARAAEVSVVAGDNQTAAAGSAVPIPPSVRVEDEFGNLVANATVTFSVLTGGGQVTNGVRTTNAQGIATVGSWILGPVAGIQALSARVEENGVANNPIIFTATATTPTGSQIVAMAGNNQQAPVGRLVPVAPTVLVRNAAGNGVPGVVVNFAVATGGGTVVGSRQVTDVNGTATVGGWFLGPLPGANTLTASSAGLTPVTFTATGIAAAPASMVAVSQTTQSAPAGTNVGDPPSVIVRDAQGIPVQGVIVTFTVSAGGGSVVGSPDTTNANGVATLASWRLGAVLGPNTVTATAPGLPSVTFSATGTAGAAATVVATAGNNQTAVQGTAVPLAPTVRVTDANGNPVIGATVTFAVTQGGGTATGLTQATNTQGQATVGSWTLGTGAPNTLTATVTGSGILGNPVTFTAQSATQIAITNAPAGPINLGTNFTITAQLRNAAGAAVALPGVQLTIAIASGGGTLNGTVTRVTDASGAVSFTLINVTGTAGARTFSVSGTGLATATTAAINFN